MNNESNNESNIGPHKAQNPTNNRLTPKARQFAKQASKWLAVVAATAAVVTTVQVSADNDGQGLQVLPLDPPATETSSDSETSKTGFTEVWAPSAGFADLIEHVSPAVVHVATSGFIRQSRSRNYRDFQFPPGWEEFFREFQTPRGNDSDEPDDDGDRQTRPLGIGSGFVISSDGFVVTNHHVIDRADEIVVTLTDGTEYDAQIIGSDPQTDLALLKLDNAQDLAFVSWGDDERSRVGDWVVAIGNPFGLGGSASTGIISAIGRDIRSGPYDDYIQVDAAINRGNSGGPLFNTRGEVIGINTAIYSPNGGSVGIGFSIPATMAKNVIRQLQEDGRVERGWIGVGIQALSDELAESLGREDDSGALITGVEPGTPAAEAGLMAGDIILNFGGTQIDEMRDLPKAVAQSPVGDTYSMTIWRDGKTRSMSITTAPFPEDIAQGNQPSEPEQATEDDLLGAQLQELDDATRERFQIGDSVNGVLVVQVERGGLAASNGLRRGDVIVQLDGERMNAPDDVAYVLTQASNADRERISMLVNRGGNSRFLAFDLSN